jgi:TolC family type I secretion outer membrane protein
MKARPIELALAAAIALGAVPAARACDDPFAVGSLSASSPRASAGPQADSAPCAFEDVDRVTLTLGDVLERALCNNPQTRVAWANARAQAEQVGIARSAFMPTLSADLSASRNRQVGGTRIGVAPVSGSTLYNQESAGLSAAYVLYDFGARDASLAVALQTLAAANFTQDATLQRVFLAAVQGYYQLFAARAAVDSAREAERAAQESLKAASARYDTGVGTPADKYQAQTAYSQAVLNRIQAEGNAKGAEGVLSNAMGLDANRPLKLAAPVVTLPDRGFESNLDELIATARRQRPDLAAAEAKVKAAQAGVDVARAAGRPTISLSAGASYTDTSLASAFQSQSVGISVNIPIFTGFNTLYSVRAAQAQAEGAAAQRDSVSLQVALDVWQAYYALTTSTQAVRSAADLVTSAAQSERVALGRYKAGAGSIIDLLTAQTALASARLQNIQAIYTWHTARAALAQAMGQLDIAAPAKSDTGTSAK